MHFRFTVVMAALALAACQGSPDQSLTDPTVQFDNNGPGCSINNLKSAARRYFSPADRRVAMGLIEELQEIVGSDPAGARDLGFDILALISEANDAGRPRGKPKDGSTMANAALGCMGVEEDLPIPFGDALRHGAFQVRAGATDPTPDIISQDGFSGLGLTGNASWQSVFDVRTLVWGQAAPQITFAEILVDLPFNWSTIPAHPTVNAGLIMGFCVENPGNLRVAEKSSDGTEQILNLVDPSFFLSCPNLAAGPEANGPFGRILSWAADALAPEPLHAAALNPGPVGGSTRGFSGFGVVDAVAINLSFTQEPTNTTVNQFFTPPIVVTAVGNGGTPLPEVSIRISLVPVQG
ncbi:MAG: hypothetical protein ACREL6_12425, partial [Gemmatimonadales bacterium]